MTNVYCYAICHNHTERWYSPTYADDHADDWSVSPWQDDFNRSDVWHPSDIEDEDFPDLPQLDGVDIAHWVALTWDDYARLCGIDA